MAAPKGNKFALGNSGTSKRWVNVADLISDIDSYFKWADDNPMQKVHPSAIDKETGMPIVFDIDRPYTIEGLATFLKTTRDTLLNYEKAEGYEVYFDAIKAAKNRIQQNKVERGLTGNAPSATTIFDLKNNHGYKDRSETDVTTGGESINQISLGSGVDPNK